MMYSVYLKTLYDKRFFILGWTIGFAALSALMTSFYPAMHQDGTFEALAANLPSAFKGLIGNIADLSSFPTYLASQLFDIRLPLIAGIMAIILGLGLSVSDEEKGELRTVLSLPIGRMKLFIHKWLAMITIMAVASLGLIVGVYAVAPLIDGASIEFEPMFRLVAMTWLIMITFGTIPFSVGFATGKRAVASAVSILVIIGSFLLSTFSQAVEWLQNYEKLSLLHYFPAADIVKTGVEVGDIAVFVVVTLVLLVGSLVIFRSRDVA